jgi:hypothetical protein
VSRNILAAACAGELSRCFGHIDLCGEPLEPQGRLATAWVVDVTRGTATSYAM